MNVSELFKDGIRVLVDTDSKQEAVLLSEGWKAADAADGKADGSTDPKPDKADKSKGKGKAADAADGDTSTP